MRNARLHFGHGTQNARDEAAWLVGKAVELAPADLAGSLDYVTNSRESSRIQVLLEKRINTRKPLAYLIGEAWLSGQKFIVDQRVIVPRSFIAELLADRLRPWCTRPGSIRRVLDLCTGSGCLAILAASAFPRASIDAADLSKHALVVARKNVKAYGLTSRIRLIQTDLLEQLPMREYDLIISNPPYVNAAAMRNLPIEYRREPVIALAGGRDGLDLVVRIFNAVDNYLTPRGHLIMEIGHNRAAFERRYPQMPVTWLNTTSSLDAVLWVSAQEVTEWRSRSVRH